MDRTHAIGFVDGYRRAVDPIHLAATRSTAHPFTSQAQRLNQILMLQQAQAWGHSNGFDPDCQKCPRRAPALPSLHAGFQIHRDALVHHKVICQLRKSFILVKTHDGFLLCFDQHAVDERIRLERLLRAVSAATTPTVTFVTASSVVPASLPSTSNETICRVSIKPMVLKCFSPEQLALLATPPCKAFLARFFFDYQLLPSHNALILRSIPRIVDAVPDVYEFLPRLLRDFQGMQLHQRQHRHAGATTKGSSGRGGGGGGDDGTVSGLFLPSALRDTLNSRACRYAIMFHTELSRARCKALLHQLATTCAFPFQCAHGRPSCVPLCRLDDNDDDDDAGAGAGVIYDVDVQQRTWRPMGQRDPPPIPLRFRRGVRTVHLRRFGERTEAAVAMDGGGR